MIASGGVRLEDPRTRTKFPFHTSSAKKLNVTPAAPSDDPVMPMAQDETNTLNSTAKGKDFDKAYIDDEVKVHKAVLDLATKAAGQTQNAALKNLIQKAAPVIQGHLT